MRRAWVLWVISLGLAARAGAADLDAAKAAIADAQAKYETYSADIDMTMGSGDTGMKSSGTVRGKGQRFAARASVEMQGNVQKLVRIKDAAGFIWEEQDEHGEVSITKSSAAMSELTGFPLATVLNLLEKLRTGPGALKNVLGAFGKQYDINTVRKETVDGEKLFVFEGPMRESLREVAEAARAAEDEDEDQTAVAETITLVFRMVADMYMIRIAIAESDGLPRVIEGLRADGTTSMKQTFKNVAVGMPIDDSEFVYTVPAGEEVVDFL